jgi:urate oxidase
MTYDYAIGYGKRRVPVYRVHAAPLAGVTPIPESPFVGRTNALFALEVDVEVLGGDFLAAYTRGDNSRVVATDSMKNFVLRQALAYEGATIEGFLHFLGRGFIVAYEQIRSLRVTGRELPFVASPVPGEDGFVPSDLLFDRIDADHALGMVELRGDGAVVTDHRCGRIGLRLMKTTGSAFTSFVRDGYTTLPDRRDRPLYITLDVEWRYSYPADLFGGDPARYVPSEQVRDLIRTVFDGFVSESIQHLVHQFGLRLLDRFPQLAEVAFRAENRTRDPIAESDADPRVKVYSDPFSGFGEIRLTMRRS